LSENAGPSHEFSGINAQKPTMNSGLELQAYHYVANFTLISHCEIQRTEPLRPENVVLHYKGNFLMSQHAKQALARPENVALLSDIIWPVRPLFNRTC